MTLFSAESDESYRAMFYKYGAATAQPQQPKPEVPKAPVQEAKKSQPKKEEDDIDLFGDDEPTAPQVQKKPAVVAPAAKAKKAVIAKSIVVFDVKVYEQEQDLKALAEKIFQIQIDGLVWNKEPKILPIAFGMCKLQVGCVIEDDKVGTDDIFEKIEAWEDEVQSVDVVTFNKL